MFVAGGDTVMGILLDVSEQPTQGVGAEGADAIMQTINEGAYLLAQRENGRALYSGMGERAYQMALWLDRIARDERVHKAAHFLALRQNGRTDFCRMDKFADQAAEMETGIWHDDFPFF